MMTLRVSLTVFPYNWGAGARSVPLGGETEIR